jgi:hypothetical protein
MAGGYSNVSLKDLTNLEQDEVFARAYKTARHGFMSQYNAKIGKLVGLREQVVAGMNYQFTFETTEGEYVVTVFCQPWTDTYEVTSIQPVSKTQ